MAALTRIRLCRTPETLHEHTVEPIVFHPFEVQVHGTFVIRREKTRTATIGMLQPGRICLLIFADIRPHVDAHLFLISEPSAFLRLMKPALITGHNKPVI